MKRKIFVSVFCIMVLLVAFVWQLAAGGVTVGPRVGETSEGSNTLYPDETLYSNFRGATIVSIDGTLGPGWNAYGYHKEIGLMREDMAFVRNAHIWIMNDAQYLYIALNFTQYQQDNGDRIWLYFDENHNHGLDSVSSPSSQSTDDRARQWISDDVKSRLLWGGLIIQPYIWDGFWNGTWVTEDYRGGFIIFPPLPDPTPTGTVDFDVAFSFDAGDEEQIVEWMIPLDSLDRFDINCKSGNMLGLYIVIYDADPSYEMYYMWPHPSAAGTLETQPWNWGDLWTTKVFSASIPHAHDDVGTWRAYLGVQNTGTKESTVVFVFDDWVSEETVAAGGSTAGFVKDFHGGTDYVGPILIYSDQPFTALMNQRNAASTIIGQTTYVGEN